MRAGGRNPESHIRLINIDIGLDRGVSQLTRHTLLAVAHAGFCPPMPVAALSSFVLV